MLLTLTPLILSHSMTNSEDGSHAHLTPADRYLDQTMPRLPHQQALGTVKLDIVRKNLLERMGVWSQGLLHMASLTSLECRSDHTYTILTYKARRGSGLAIWIAQWRDRAA